MSIYIERASNIGVFCGAGIGMLIGGTIQFGLIYTTLALSPLSFTTEYIATGKCDNTRKGLNHVCNLDVYLINNFINDENKKIRKRDVFIEGIENTKNNNVEKVQSLIKNIKNRNN
jgi:hypothetical protein